MDRAPSSLLAPFLARLGIRRVTPKFVLAGVLSIQAMLLLWLWSAHRIPNGHDAFIYLTLQYVFFNSAATTGQIPQWLPYLTQGNVAAWWYALQAAPFQAALLPLACVFRSASFLSLFYIGIFVDFVVLAVGTYLLSRRFLNSQTAVFMTVATAVFSTFWYSQPYSGLHFFYAVPLILHFLHDFFESGSARDLALAGSLFVLQIFGNGPYFVGVTSFAISLYLAIYLLSNQKECESPLRRALRDWRTYAAAGALIALVAGAYALLSLGTGEIVFRPDLGRDVTGPVSFSEFVGFDAGLGPWRWAELILGMAPGLDYSLFIGYFALPLLLASFFAINRKNAAFFIVAAALALLAEGYRPVAWLFFQVWPFAKFYRHLSLLASFMRLFLCFLVGFGAERLASLSTAGSSRKFGLRGTLIVFSFALIAVSVSLLWLGLHSAAMDSVMRLYRSLGGAPPVGGKDFAIDLVHADSVLTSVALFQRALWRSATVAAAAGLALLVLCVSRRKEYRSAWIAVACVIQLADLGSYNVFEAINRTYPIKAAAGAFDFEPMPYAARRLPNIFTQPTARFAVFLREYPFMGSNIATNGLFFFSDCASNAFRTDNWLKPLGRLLEAYGFSEPSYARLRPDLPWIRLPFLFPGDKPGAAEISGLNADKLQFFSIAHAATDQDDAARVIGNPVFRGNALIVETARDVSAASDLAPMVSLKNERVSLPYRVLEFDSNHLVAEIDNRDRTARWLFYSDVWHPGWRATVNGDPAEIYRADIAYKAVPIPPGRDRVEFIFWSPWVFALRCGLCALAWFWLAVLIRLFVYA